LEDLLWLCSFIVASGGEDTRTAKVEMVAAIVLSRPAPIPAMVAFPCRVAIAEPALSMGWSCTTSAACSTRLTTFDLSR
jgi:hypothetical protein